MTDTPNKPNCYQCIHRRNLLGNTHSKCVHPTALVIRQAVGELVIGLAEFFPGKPVLADKLGITAHQHGIDKGWFAWPANFDPTWLLTCNGFEGKGAAS